MKQTELDNYKKPRNPSFTTAQFPGAFIAGCHPVFFRSVPEPVLNHVQDPVNQTEGAAR